MKKAFIGFILVAALVAAGFWYTNRGTGESGSTYRFVTVEQGDLEAVVSATGSLGAVTTVQVGTQVSGIVNQIYVDFNDRVRKGQLIARIDTTLLVSAIRDAEANLDRVRAQLAQAERERTRVTDLYEKQFVAETEYNTAIYNYDVAQAQVRSAEISLERARQNLSYATIYSPISGVVIERNVDVGQTVAASLSAPQLFLIANDLAQMQILASVDESDIGLIEEGQTARFTVQAYPDESFFGEVRQVRMQSAVQENVVSYTVVVDVDNRDGRLLPGMTAIVEFLVDSAEGVFKIPNAALRFRPTESMMAQFRAQMEARRQAASGDSTSRTGGEAGSRTSGSQGGTRTGGTGGGFPGQTGGGFGGQTDMVMLWYFDADGNLAATRARTGITDGSETEVSGRDIVDGMQVIAGVTESQEDGTINPFQNNSSGGGRRFGAF